ncbi:dicarboxylate/amino acid:cation symporter [Ilyobacter sp.]|uniref:dicarboxylate/amino acid:cation symporter n=1 Tax=Ilyobacter sp. TaxID=3100343 RepID=UPI003566FC0B
MLNKSKSKIGLANKIFIGMLVGLIIGLISPQFGQSLKPIGDVFMRLLRMGVVPLIYANVVYGICQMEDAKSFGRAGSKLVGFYLVTTACAAVIGSFVGMITKPGVSINLDVSSTAADVQKMSGFWDTVQSFIPVNILQALAEGKLPQIIVFAIFTGIAVLMIGGETKVRIVGAFGDIGSLMLKIITIVMEFSPYGIAALMAWTAGKFGTDIFGPLAKFIGSVYLGLILQIVFVYLSSVIIFAKLRPMDYLTKTKPIWLTAFTLCSSAATIPVSLKTAEEDMGLPKKISSFSIPMGATMNMDGNAIWFGVMGVFACQLVGIDVTFSQILQFSILGVILTLGSPGIPGGIFVSTAIFLSSLGLPLEAGAMMIGVFRLLDMGMTATNTLGDITATTVVSAWEKLFDGKTSPYWNKSKEIEAESINEGA